MDPAPDPTREYQTSMLAIGKKVERALSVASERRIHSVWEFTQSAIAVLVVATTCGGVVVRALLTENPMPPEWWTIVGLVVGFYFGRVRPPAPVRSGAERDRASDRRDP